MTLKVPKLYFFAIVHCTKQGSLVEFKESYSLNILDDRSWISAISPDSPPYIVEPFGVETNFTF